MIHLKNTCPELFQRTQKTLFLLFTIVMTTFASGCYLLNKTDEPDNDFTFCLTQWPEGRAGAVSLICNDYNVTDDLFYKNSYALLQKYGFKASFFINSKFLKSFAEKPDDSVVWTRLKEYAAAGHEIALALYINNDEIQNAEDVLKQANDYRDLLKKRLNIDLKSIILAKNNFGQCDINWYWQLEKHGYFVNRYNFLRSQYIS